MDEAAAAETREDRAENKPRNGDAAPGSSVGGSAEVKDGVKQCNIECNDCGLTFTHWDVFKTHLHQHALEDEEGDGQKQDNRNSEAELFSGREDNEETGGEPMEGDEWNESSSSQTNPLGLQGDEFATASMKDKLRNVYACHVCGKLYTYLVSFRKHQQLHEIPHTITKPNLNRYECPDCGMTFVRRTRLLSHLQVHRSKEEFKSQPQRCDQCNIDFSSVKTWMNHVEKHKENPFWCLSCAKGFRNEVLLNKHLQDHSLMLHKCDICRKRFQTLAQLTCHYNIHTRALPHQGSLSGKTYPRKLLLHGRNRLRVYGSNRTSLGMKRIKGRRRFFNRRFLLTSVREEPEMDPQIEEPPGGGESVAKSESQNPCDDAECEDCASSDESDCGEPMHNIRLLKAPGSAGCDPLDESKSQTVQPQSKLHESEPQEAKIHREHKYWEWECFECDMGFDDVEMLHLHYIKHATGELPFQQDGV